MVEQVTQLEKEAMAALEAVADEEALSAWRSAYLGRKGAVVEANSSTTGLPVTSSRSSSGSLL